MNIAPFSRAASRAFCVGLAVLLVSGSLTSTAAAATNLAPQASISFTFDDGLASSIKLAAPALKSRGLTGTNYVTTNCVGMTNVPNSCRADRDKPYMTWAQVKNLQNNFKWEIGSHTASHPLLASSDAGDGQPNPLTVAQIRKELVSSKSALVSHGLNVKSFAAPYGDYNPRVLSEVAKVYTNFRGFADTGMNEWPYNEYLLYNLPITSTTTVASVKSQIDEAIAQKKWLILTFHDVVSAGTEGMRPMAPSAGRHTYSYDYSVTKLAQIADYVAAKQSSGLIKNVNPGSAMMTGTSLFANSTFAAGISKGWTTDAPAAITANRANNGSFPSANNSVRLVSNGGADKHLYSPLVSVTHGTMYGLKLYLNVTRAASGSYIGQYVDEYDAAGNWISGQFKASENSVFAENLNDTYTPSSAAVASMRLQIYIGGGMTAFVDNAQLIALSSTPTTNLITNAHFNAGISGGWTTDSARIAADALGNGAPSGAKNSVSLRGSANETHLLSPRITVIPSESYTISSYLSVLNNGGDTFGYYIDEYDSAGEWVSGQYALSVSSGASDRTLGYTPSSAQVAAASLQLIVPAGDTAHAYFDWVRWYQD